MAHQALLSMEFSRQEYWSGLPFPSRGRLMKCKSHITEEVELRSWRKKILLFSQSIQVPLSFLSFLAGPLINSITLQLNSLTSGSRYLNPTLLLLFSHSVMSNSRRPHGLQHVRPPSPSLSPRHCSDSCSLSRWNYLTILPYQCLNLKQLNCLLSLPILLQSWVLLEKSHNFIYWQNYICKISVDRKMPPTNILMSQEPVNMLMNLRICDLIWQKGLCRCD